MTTLLLTLACSGLGGALDAEQQLILSAVSGEEEAFAKDGFAEPDASEEVSERAPLFRDCDPAGLHAELRDDADADDDGELSDREEKECSGEGGPHEKDRQVRMHMLGLIYDLDGDLELSETERDTLFADFELRCEAIHDQLIADFDADGDGELNETEKDDARAAIEAEHEARRAEMEARRDEMDGGEGPPEDGERPDEEGGMEGGDRGEMGPPEGVPPFAESYDADGDGELSDAELEVLRAECRERIQNGEPPFDPPAAVE